VHKLISNQKKKHKKNKTKTKVRSMLSTEMMTELRSPNEWIGNYNDTENFVPMFRVRNVSGFRGSHLRVALLQFHWSFFFGFLEIPEIRRCCEVE